MDTQNDLTPKKKGASQRWQIAANINLPVSAGCEIQASSQIADVMARLNLPAENLERIRQAVCEAALKVIDGYTPDGVHAGLIVRLQASPKVRELLSPIKEETETSTVSAVSPSLDDDSNRGWGFFLIERTKEDQAAAVIELFLYLEGDDGAV